MKRITLSTLASALLLAFASSAAVAGDHETEGFHGYLRAGVGSSNAGGSQSCYGLGGITMAYRLGNECDSFTEFGYTHTLAKSSNGAEFVGTIWADAYKNSSDFGDAKLGVSKAYVEAKNLPFMNGGIIWAGKRHYYRPDIHMLDMQYINMNGTGGGVDGYPVGPGKISYAVFKDNDDNVYSTDPATGVRTLRSTSAALRQNVVYEGLPVNPNGTLDFAVSLIHAQDDNKNVTTHNGYQVSMFHRQAKLLGGGNTVGVQYGVGPGTGINGPCCARMGPSGSTLLGSDVTRVRVFDDIVIQPTRDFSMEFVALYQRDKSDLGGSSTWTTVGARPVYALAENFKLQAELGVSRLKDKLNPTPLRLTKLTLAPTITLGRDYYARPELRAFVSYGKWNDAAKGAVNAFNNGGPVYGDRTSGTSYGVHLEAWW
ncbi:carbohydrate porin [Massilia sp. P8910]|uniref:maltoporin n=1 Tax=Massilia antarctica TaxID=2765360 RepID=UPI0006BB6A3F|nr:MULTISPECIES: carbohydrate porin [Massilia]MCE3607834.1 carbohydrate porin [Massilia antarctica]MCY0911856.1 carbohydrate porin [Massilia sp. H27-R4]CUI06688.1 Maltoporin (maltose/maltodextrin high-affinity receptor, phage lambda receptor protein) [Janthinobacterium sp. CG23_2]CUU30474.1 Maltoporin (maltose/maltodextrin high-affinity receptor, phage lambda receptor protein) [Janthinobacterium sp. CG23_2]